MSPEFDPKKNAANAANVAWGRNPIDLGSSCYAQEAQIL
jgi:hypothetical protein